ncbi:MAG: YlxR family protein [Firmicutes bacterium]|nr:YlxR family protein [Bacillota bacterium]
MAKGQRVEPQRMCAACREMKDKRDLLRIVRSPEGEISLDPSGKRAGRGAYLCRKQACLKRLQKSRSLEKAFKMKLPEEIWDLLTAEIAAAALREENNE